jgi:hypothetical protein
MITISVTEIQPLAFPSHLLLHMLLHTDLYYPLQHIVTLTLLHSNYNNLKYSVYKIYILIHFVFTLCMCAQFCAVELLVTEHITNVANTTHKKLPLLCCVFNISCWIHETSKSVDASL